MEVLLLIVAGGMAGYIVSILTWPRLRQAIVGVENEIDDLRAKARALEATLRS